MQTLDIPRPHSVEPFYPLTLDQYESMIAAGILGEDDRVELLWGHLSQLMPTNPPHAGGVFFAQRLLVNLTDGARSLVFTERPIMLPPRSAPQPDLCVANFASHYYLSVHPRPNDLQLVVEVSDETLAKDRTTKLRMYAEAGIVEYWIINLRDYQLERHTEPIFLDDGKGAYAKTEVFARDAVLEHERFGVVKVAKLLPPDVAADSSPYPV